MFILVFTCLNIRAVHFKLLRDMSSENFILAFQRFCNMHTIPQYLYSNNAKSFLKGGSILENSLLLRNFELNLINVISNILRFLYTQLGLDQLGRD